MRKLPVSLLPNGSILQKVMIPQYDPKLTLTAILRSEVLTIINEHTVDGRQVSIEFFNPDRSRRGKIELKNAIFDQTKGTLNATEAVAIQSENFSATGSGLVYTYERAKGFLTGPVKTRFVTPPKTK